MPTDTPQKFVGSTAWAELGWQDEADIDRALLRSENELVLDFKYEGRRFTATLTRTTANEFRGTYATELGGKPIQGTASCRVYTYQQGLFLFGRWFEDNKNYMWWAELKAVERFRDEAPNR